MEILFSFVLAVLALAISPGPDNIFVLTQSIVHGKKYGIATVLGLMTGCIVHTTIVAFGVSVIIVNSNTIFYLIKALGAAYLLFLAYKVYKSDTSILMDENSVKKKTTKQLFKVGFFMNVLNPKVTIFFMALFPGFLFSETMPTVVQFYILGGLFIMTSFTVFTSIAFLGGTISDTIQKSKSIGIWLKWMQILVFIGVAIFILL